MLKLEKKKKNYIKKCDDEYEKYYKIHHMHHFKTNNGVKHELHHCFLFAKRNMRGKKFKIIHKVEGNNVYHCLLSKYEGVLFDHLNNSYKIVSKKITGGIIYEIQF